MAGLCLAVQSIRCEVSDGQAPSQALAAQWQEYLADVPKTIIALQPFRRTSSVQFETAGQQGKATLVDLNPRINSWYLLTLWWPGAEKPAAYHLQNPLPHTQTLSLSQDHPTAIRLSVSGQERDCELWPDGRTVLLLQARRSQLPYAPLCENRLFVRNPVAGSYTHLERLTDMLRDDVWGGEQIVGFVRKEFFADAFIEKAEVATAAHASAAGTGPASGPRPALLGVGYADQLIVPAHTEIDVGERSGGLSMGQWYPARDATGISFSIIQPQALAPSSSSVARNLRSEDDSIEASALDYLVALDLGRFEVGFALGTDHPRVGWSERALESVRDARLPGPDGIGEVAPLVVNGMLDPLSIPRAAATFAGGFKRGHGAFHYGALAQQNHGSHYGFIEQGVIFSKLQPGLSTLLVEDDGSVAMKTWTAQDERTLLPQLKDARQNGVPLIEYDPDKRTSSPGALVDSWGPGNWSGSSDERLRTVRAGACIQETATERYLIYGYFSTATPGAMARVFQAYGCRYAMHLDMNALEHTYFAIYVHRQGRIIVEHLIDGMAEVDRKGGEALAPRFLGFPDDRDFFYVLRKEGAS